MTWGGSGDAGGGAVTFTLGVGSPVRVEVRGSPMDGLVVTTVFRFEFFSQGRGEEAEED